MYQHSSVGDERGLGFFQFIIPAVSVVGGLLFRRGGEEQPVGGAGGVKVDPQQARAIVSQLYGGILRRAPDYPGAQGYVDCLVEGWCDASFIEQELLASAEYAQKAATGAWGAAGPPTSTPTYTPTTTGGAPPPLGPGAFASGPSVIDQMMPYLPYAIGGVVLLSILKKK